MTQDIYLDTNATTPVLSAALAAVDHALRSGYGNPSSSHSTGIVAKRLMEKVRQQAMDLIGAGSGSVVFVSGATEGIQTAVLSALCALRERRERGEPVGRLLVYGATEHKAVPESLAHWNRVLGLGFEMRVLPVKLSGHHDLDLLTSWASDIGLLCTMAANNETGVVSDMVGIERVLVTQTSTALWLADCVQALGKLPLNLARTRIDYAPFSGHKLYAPKGIGMLYVREGSPFTALMVGGGQEGGLRAGTENMAGIAALGAVFEALADGRTFCSYERLVDYRTKLANSLVRAFPGLVFNADFEHALPTTLNFSVPGVPSAVLLDLFDAAGVRVSAGSACSAAKAATSPVLQAMGLEIWQAESAVRVSFGPVVDESFPEAACAAIAVCGQALQASRQQAEHTPLPTQNVLGAHAQAEASVKGLDWVELPQFLSLNPTAQLVDVREGYEYLASHAQHGPRMPTLNVPLSRLNHHASVWLAQPQVPVVFFCRSGRRSLKAAIALQQQGHAATLHVSGGLVARD